LPWSGDQPPFGFSPDDAAAAPWLPQPAHWAELSVEQQDLDPESMLNLYRSALRLRSEHLRGDDAVTWVDAPLGALAFRRGDLECWVNTGWDPVPLPDGEVLLCSDPHAGQGELPSDSAAWVVVA
jgi:alpha-glucosidase